METYKLFKMKNWYISYNTVDSNSAAEYFQNSVIHIFEKTVPLKKATGRRKYPVWFSGKFIKKLKKK